MELGCTEDRAPLPELVHPVVQRRLGHNDNVGPSDATVFMQVAQQRDGLQRLAQTLQGHNFAIRVGLEASQSGYSRLQVAGARHLWKAVAAMQKGDCANAFAIIID